MSEPINTTPLWLALRDRTVYDGASTPDFVTTEDDNEFVTDEGDSRVTAD